ncbi:aminopeptidase P family protein [Gynuella sunshinyii]|uniref:Xaa-Pro aminopeptidase n=1 Tax=Gynuella sunshinyii YC6258 TaxID=1445510 RepID=A0A0C5VDW5_9GAMM|nr:aminopeptidase P family protein [Gynuella sunshinyii]AJQ92401.1 xaa-Pro aminopeptidase [Gynuella sunshinyii YC6258]
MSDIASKLTQVREQMEKLGLDALIVPRADEYLGEYIPAYNERLRWISDFTGSAGMVIVLKDRAAIFVDGRYTVQVRQQVNENLFDIFHLIKDPQPEWLSQQLKAGAKVGFDSRTVTPAWYEQCSETLADANIQLLDTEVNLIDLCWHDRPKPIVNKALLLDKAFTGMASTDKRDKIAQLIRDKQADAALIFAADSCNWLLNIRGRDIPSLPIILGIAVLHSNGNMVFHCNINKLPAGIEQHVGIGVTFKEESELSDTLNLLAGKQVIVDTDTANAWCMLKLRQVGARIIESADPVIEPKACKNRVEIQGFKQAHIRDAAAEVEFLCWLDKIVAEGQRPDEASLSNYLFNCRARQKFFVEVSFDTISAAGSNAAMCHYNHVDGTPAKLPDNGIYLVDSGGQYFDGTTDITRTVAIGEVTETMKRNFTLVLKGHIALDQARFPEGTTGSQLDVLARQYLWQQGLDFDHGTGHGVGHFMSVHEGPQRISPKGNNATLKEGMVISNEPGYYEDGNYGIRCENLMFVTRDEAISSDRKPFYRFEALTLVPFDLRLVKRSLLTDVEALWLNNYHQRVYDTISPLLTDEQRTWLKNACRSI